MWNKIFIKKIFSIAELQKDNEKDVLYFDEEFDDTPYEIIEKYKKKKMKCLLICF